MLSIRKIGVISRTYRHLNRYRHILGPTKIVNAGTGRVETYTSYLVVRTTQDGPMSVFSAGSYRDEVVFEDGAPKLGTRNVVLDSELVDTLLSLPI